MLQRGMTNLDAKIQLKLKDFNVLSGHQYHFSEMDGIDAVSELNDEFFKLPRVDEGF
ncbi:hypothetical protein [Brevundimonas sp.]|uniref:hypothetical protein n=1 Tax=Brevundimonas sp. TaxID=1871086 RepID=UPI0025BF72C1|nr:hypothetical protein [Brevundimonas sp.]MCG2665105.1 hypothetical protein [Brevundimonas sp.]